MTDIEQRARDALNAAYGYAMWNIEDTRDADPHIEAMCREIEAHEATKAELADFKREVSDGLRAYFRLDIDDVKQGHLGRFIQPDPVKVDPLLGVVEEAIAGTAEQGAINLRAAIAKRGGKIVWEGEE